MPITVNRRNKECPECKNTTLFICDGEGKKKYFCNKCLNEFSFDDKRFQGYKENSVSDEVELNVVPDIMISNVIQDQQLDLVNEAIKTKTEDISNESLETGIDNLFK